MIISAEIHARGAVRASSTIDDKNSVLSCALLLTRKIISSFFLTELRRLAGTGGRGGRSEKLAATAKPLSRGGKFPALILRA